MGSPGFPSNATFGEGETSFTKQTMTGTSSGSEGGGGDSVNKIAGGASAGMGLVQMAVGMYQLNKANKLPFPSYQKTKGPFAEMKSIYQGQMRQGIGSEQRGNMGMQNAQLQAQQMNAVSQSSPQASAVFGRTAALDRTKGTMQIAQADQSAKIDAMSGVERMNNALTAIEQKDIAAARDFRIRAEQAAGQAIARGSENIAKNIAGQSTA
jgi:hypothetical protein